MLTTAVITMSINVAEWKDRRGGPGTGHTDHKGCKALNAEAKAGGKMDSSIPPAVCFLAVLTHVEL